MSNKGIIAAGFGTFIAMSIGIGVVVMRENAEDDEEDVLGERACADFNAQLDKNPYATLEGIVEDGNHPVAYEEPACFEYAIEQRLSHEDPRVRSLSTEVVVTLKLASLYPLVPTMLDDKEPKVVVAAIKALRETNPPALDAKLEHLLTHSDKEVRATVMHRGIEKGLAAAGKPLMELARDYEHLEYNFMVKSLRELDAADHFVAGLRSLPEPPPPADGVHCHGSAFRIAEVLRRAEAYEKLATALDSPAVTTRLCVCAALHGQKAESVVRALEKVAASDDDQLVQEAAKTALL